jgi:crotonobetainyl-CoA:carnitine CoA-transferase CaiB-like acyl-CoA transferase
MRVGIPVADLTAGLFCAMGILTALLLHWACSHARCAYIATVGKASVKIMLRLAGTHTFLLSPAAVALHEDVRL